MEQEIIQVDSFTNKPFAGNPAAICVMGAPAETEWMQKVAREMNLSETAFVWPLQSGELSLRWFTPNVEVDLCGHATLAAAHVLWETKRLALDATARFQTRSGLLTARCDGAWIEMDFPATPPQPAAPPPGMIDALGPAGRDAFVECGRSRFDYLVQLDLDQSGLEKLRPDLRALSQIEARAVIVTSQRPSDTRFDFVSRFFAPRCGIDEDPVTGSAHCALAPWWADRLGKESMLAYQASPRGGVVRVTMKQDRVLLGGQAVTVMRGTIVC
jgi:PhzF family phenazine biosynthesis protein